MKYIHGSNMRKILFIIIVICLSACSLNNSNVKSNEITSEQLSLRITELNEKISILEEQVNTLTETVNQPDIVYPIMVEEDLLYVNAAMPFAFTINNVDKLPLKSFSQNGSISLFYETEDIIQFIDGYTLVPSILVRENNDHPDFYDTRQIVKRINEEWVVVRIPSIETSLDDATNQKIRVMLDDIKYY